MQRTTNVHGGGSQVARMIQLLLVITVMAIVLAVGIPTMLSASERAQDTAAQTAVRKTIQNAWTIYVESGDFSRADPSNLAAEEPAIEPVGALPSQTPRVVSTGSGCVGACFYGGRHNRFVAAAKSDTGHCWFAQAFSDQAGADPRVTWDAREGVECVAANAPAFDDFGGADGWTSDPSQARD